MYLDKIDTLIFTYMVKAYQCYLNLELLSWKFCSYSYIILDLGSLCRRVGLESNRESQWKYTAHCHPINSLTNSFSRCKGEIFDLM